MAAMEQGPMRSIVQTARDIRADPHASAQDKRTLRGLETMISNVYEKPVMRDTNPFMGTHYGEPPRTMDHSASRRELPFLDLLTTQSTLGADHFYDNPLPTAPGKPPAPKTR